MMFGEEASWHKAMREINKMLQERSSEDFYIHFVQATPRPPRLTGGGEGQSSNDAMVTGFSNDHELTGRSPSVITSEHIVNVPREGRSRSPAFDDGDDQGSTIIHRSDSEFEGVDDAEMADGSSIVILGDDPSMAEQQFMLQSTPPPAISPESLRDSGDSQVIYNEELETEAALAEVAIQRRAEQPTSSTQDPSTSGETSESQEVQERGVPSPRVVNPRETPELEETSCYHHDQSGLESDEEQDPLIREVADDQPLTGGTAPSQQILYNQSFLNKDQWEEVCTVLDHPHDQILGGKLLMGTKQGLLVHQMAFIVRAMKSQLAEPELNGLLVADNVGLGKSICALGLFAVTSLVIHNARHTRLYPDMHLERFEKQHGLKCPSGNPFGIQCVCVPGSITRCYLRRLVGGPSVIAVPASNLDAWASRIKAFFNRYIHVRTSMGAGATIEELLIEPVIYRETGQLTSIPLDGLEKQRVRSRDLLAKVLSKSHGYKMRHEFVYEPLQAMTYDQLRQELGETVHLRFEAPQAPTMQFRFLLLISYQALSQNNSCVEKLFGSRTRIRRPKKLKIPPRVDGIRRQGVLIKIPFTIAATLVIFDESHLVVKRDSALFKCFRRIQQLSEVDDRRRTRWCFMTATPFSNSPDDVASSLEILISDPKDRQEVLRSLPEFTARFRQLQNGRKQQKQGEPEAGDSTAKFANDFANFMRPFTVARNWGSPYLHTVLQDKRPGIHYRSVEVSIPQELAPMVSRLGEKCRRKLSEMRSQRHRDLRFDDVAGATVFTQYFSAGIMPGIATAVDDALWAPLPATVKQIDEDFRLGEGSVLFKARHQHAGHEWTKELARIIKKAHSGHASQDADGSSPSTRPRHILLIAQTPSLVAHLVHWIRNEPKLQKITNVIRIFQNVTSKPAGRDTFLRNVAAEAAQSDKTYIVVTTPRLVGVGIDIVFCSYIVQFGELFSNREREQLIGRVHRPGQSLEIYCWYIKSTHQTHVAVRERNAGRSVMLSEFGLVEASAEEQD